jgi:hypothetical protein
MARALALAAPGSMAAHDDLRHVFTLFELAEQAFDADPMNCDAALKADACWVRVAIHALNCGAKGEEPSLRTWVTRRLATYARLMGRALSTIPQSYEGATL